MFLMWLGEQITAPAIGNGISLIIFRHRRRAAIGHCRHALNSPPGRLVDGLDPAGHRDAVAVSSPSSCSWSARSAAC